MKLSNWHRQKFGQNILLYHKFLGGVCGLFATKNKKYFLTAAQLYLYNWRPQMRTILICVLDKIKPAKAGYYLFINF